MKPGITFMKHERRAEEGERLLVASHRAQLEAPPYFTIGFETIVVVSFVLFLLVR